MRYCFTFLLITLFIYKSSAQTVINRYAAVLGSTGGCSNTFSVDDATGFAVGDTILMIQMKGAVIDSSNTSSFGTILAYNGAGNYELNVVSAVSGTNISLLYRVIRQYDIPIGKVQFVKVGCYPSYTVSATHSCTAWNGTKGGVFAIRVSGTLTLNADIDVSGKGFVGGIAFNGASNIANCVNDYALGPNTDSSAMKGQGIATVSLNKSYGRGKLGNGGGGGDAHNSGGGGGGNGGNGGIGGPAYWGCYGNNLTPPSVNNEGGIGGLSLNYSTSANKLFMGGGGGSGQANNYTAADGGIGGAIVIVMAATINSTGHSIIASGADAPLCSATTGYGHCDDGMGGGGGGGVVLLQVGTYSGSVNVISKGGKGADVQGSLNNPWDLYGEGGGGGGGIAWVNGASIPTNISVSVAGGTYGTNVYQNTHWGAQAGTSGTSLTSLNIPLPSIPYSSGQVTAAFTDTLIRCTTYQFTNHSGATGGIASMSWNFGAGSTSTTQNPTYTFPGPGTYTVVLTVTDNNGCISSITRNVTVQGVAPASFTDSLLACNSVRLTNTSAASLTSFQWDFGTGTTSTTRSPDYVFPGTGTYTVTLKGTDSNGCTSSISHSIAIVHGVHADFSWSPTPAEIHIPVEFSNSSTGATHYNWNLGDGTVTMVTSPSHTYNTVDTVQVCLVAKDDLGCSDSVCKSVEVDGPISIGVPSAFTPNGDGTNDVLYVKGSGIRQMHFIIFNRWGQKIFESTSQDKGWDGTFNGTPQEIDVYAYVLSATFYNGNGTTKKGNINLLR